MQALQKLCWVLDWSVYPICPFITSYLDLFASWILNIWTWRARQQLPSAFSRWGHAHCWHWLTTLFPALEAERAPALWMWAEGHSSHDSLKTQKGLGRDLQLQSQSRKQQMLRARSDGGTTRSNLELSLHAPQSFVAWLPLRQLWRLLEWPHLWPQGWCLVHDFPAPLWPQTNHHPHPGAPWLCLHRHLWPSTFCSPFTFYLSSTHHPASLICNMYIELTPQWCSKISPV